MKYEKEYNQWLEILDNSRESWMTDDEWDVFYAEMANLFSPEQFDKEVDKALDLGYSIEDQMEAAKNIFKR